MLVPENFTGVIMTNVGGVERLTSTHRVAIAVGNEVFARGMAEVLRGIVAGADISKCESREDLDLLLQSDAVDLVVVTSREHDWLEQEQRCAGRPAKILVLLSGTEGRTEMSPGLASADGFLLQQDLTAATLRRTLDLMDAGEIPMPAGLARGLLSRSDSAPASAPRPTRLTAREQQTLELMAEGLSNKQVSRRLGISAHGAKRLVTSVLLKLGAPNRTAAVVTAIRSGMIDESVQ